MQFQFEIGIDLELKGLVQFVAIAIPAVLGGAIRFDRAGSLAFLAVAQIGHLDGLADAQVVDGHADVVPVDHAVAVDREEAVAVLQTDLFGGRIVDDPDGDTAIVLARRFVFRNAQEGVFALVATGFFFGVGPASQYDGDLLLLPLADQQDGGLVAGGVLLQDAGQLLVLADTVFIDAIHVIEGTDVGFGGGGAADHASHITAVGIVIAELFGLFLVQPFRIDPQEGIVLRIAVGLDVLFHDFLARALGGQRFDGAGGHGRFSIAEVSDVYLGACPQHADGGGDIIPVDHRKTIDGGDAVAVLQTDRLGRGALDDIDANAVGRGAGFIHGRNAQKGLFTLAYFLIDGFFAGAQHDVGRALEPISLVEDTGLIARFVIGQDIAQSMILGRLAFVDPVDVIERLNTGPFGSGVADHGSDVAAIRIVEAQLLGFLPAHGVGLYS